MAKKDEVEFPQEEEFTDADTDVISVDDELDLSEAGIVADRHDFDITDVGIKQFENGKQLQVKLENVEVVGYPITEGFWLNYPSKKRVAQIGLGQLKTLGKAALGVEKFPPASLVGCVVSGYLSESQDGFAQVSRFRKPEGEEEEVE
jgi:hypothetical protein